MREITRAVKQFFLEDEWHYDEVEPGVLRVGFAAEHGTFSCFAQAREQAEQFVFYSQAPVRVPQERLPAMAEFVTRANFGMILGNFELDYSDGEIRYKTSIDIEGAALISELIRPIVYTNVTMMARYLEGIFEVAFANADPATTIARIEAPMEA